MARQPNGFEPLLAEVVSINGECHAGHKMGDRFRVGCWDTGGLCGFFYHDIFPSLSLMQFGGKYPWESEEGLKLECPDRDVAVTIRLRRA